jgi:signal transduction histidine kinase
MAIRSHAIIGLGITAIIVTVVLSPYWGIQCVAIFSLLSIFNVVINSITAVRNGRPGSQVFLCAWSLNLIAVIAFAARSFGLLPNNAWTSNIILVSTAMECFVLMLALVEKARRLAGEVSKAESVALSSLETEVASRTRQLASTQQRLIAMEKRTALSVFSAGIARQIEAPLSRSMHNIYSLVTALKSFRTYLQRLIDDDTDEPMKAEFDSRFERLQKSHSLMLEGGLRIKRIINPLLRNDANVDPDRTSFALAPIVNDAWCVAAADSQCTIAFYNDVPTAFVWSGHESGLRGTLLALFSNAIHAIEDSPSPLDGHIRVKACIEDDRQLLEVSDTGVGIATHHREKVFDAFFTTKSVGRGAGLGLTEARDSVQRWGGELTFTSSPGNGTVFRISAARPQGHLN